MNRSRKRNEKFYMNALIRRTISPILSYFRKRLALRQLPKLEDKGYGEIAKAFKEAITSSTSSEEDIWISQIESVRQKLLKDKGNIRFTDFGAGSASSIRSLSAAETGVESTRLICDVASASKSRERCLLLFKLVRALKPTSIFEMGSCVGISGSYLSAALQINGSGKFKTMEGSVEVANLASKTLLDLNLDGDVAVGAFQESLTSHLESISPVDFLFNDGHHDGDAVIEYFKKSIPKLAKRSVIIFDDINWSSSMRKSFEEIKNRDDTELSIDFRWGGLIIRDVDAHTTNHFRLWL